MIEKNVLIPGAPDQAFALFVERINEWWPPGHRPSKDRHGTVVLTPERFADIASDGTAYPIGRVVGWFPPDRIELDFYLGTGPDAPTAATITFTAEADGTRITVRHRAKPESVALWNLRAPVFEKSWTVVLEACRQLASA